MWKKVDGRWCDAYVENGKWVYQPVSFAAIYEYEPDGEHDNCFDVCIDDEGVIASFPTGEAAREYATGHGYTERAYAEYDWSDPVFKFENADADCVGVFVKYL